MMSSKLIAPATLILVFGTCVLAAVPGGSNTYLPPNKGYDYPTPSKPFIPPVTPTRPGIPSRPPTYPGTPTYPNRPGPRPTPTGPVGPTRPPTRPYQPEEHDHVHVPGMPFDFAYSVNDVNTANDYAHQAKSDGDVTKGEYRVQLPDGRTQIVRYTADWKTGYHAEVSYEGEARYPEGPSTFGGQGSGSNQGYKY